MLNNNITSILENYCEIQNPEKTGLLLLDLPTGFGKTHEVLKYIYENYQKTDKKIIFLTELKKNLPHETTLKKFFEKNNRLEDYKKDCVFINSNGDCVIENLLNNLSLIPNEVKESQEFKNLKNNIDFYNNLSQRKNKTRFDIDYAEKIKKEIQEDNEPKFRTFIINSFYEKGATKDERIVLLKNDVNFQWVAKVYPASLSFEKKVFFLSVDKFLVKNSPIVEKSYYFFDNNFLKNALIFIDEFDASKEVILKNIITNQLKKRVDIVGLFEQIYSSFTSLTIPNLFYQNSNTKIEQRENRAEKIKEALERNDLTDSEKEKLAKRQRKQENDKDISEIIENLKNEVTKINNEYNIHYSVKTIGLNNKKNFLFHDYQYHTIVGDKKNFIYLQQDDTEKINNIHFVEADASRKDKPTVTELLNVIRSFINFFKGGAKLIAENYQQIQNESRNPTDETFSFENALHTFFDELKLTKEQKIYLIDSIQIKQFQNRQNNTQNENKNDFSFYNNGFRYYDFEDSEMHNTKSKIFITDFDTTPEKMLLDLASRNFVVGISATAKMKTVVGNYDLKYLQKNLQPNYLELSEVEYQQLKTIFDDRNQNYVPIKAKFLGVENIKQTLKYFEFEKVDYNQILTQIEKSPDYEQKRYLKIAKVYEEFIKNDNIQSFLCFLNTHPDYDKSSCDLKILEMLFIAIIHKYEKENLFVDKNNDFDIKKSFKVLNSKDFEDKKNDILINLDKGQKLFLITTYATLGAGQNIQYTLENFDELHEQGKIKKVFEREGEVVKKEKDFDAIYLDKPTNLLVHLGNDLTDFDVNKRIFEVEMFFQFNKIFYKQLVYEIKRTFKQCYYKDRRFDIFFPQEVYKSLYQTEDYRNFVAKEVIQAIGRINRTNFKNNEIYVFADKDIAPNIKFFDTSTYLCLKEFEELIKQAQSVVGENTEENDVIMEIEQNNIYCHNWINKKIKGRYWNDENIADWQELREITLKYPIISKQQFDNLEELRKWQFIYVPMYDVDFKVFEPKNCYHYKLPTNKEGEELNDFKTVEVNFSGNGKEISANAVFLLDLMKINELKKMFENQNYATDFQINDYMIAPEIFNNIYKGALGEVIGKYILEKYVIPETQLQELPQNIFERFDFMLEKGVFIDFKFWNDENSEDRSKQIDKIFGLKIPDIENKGYEFQKVFIINILAQASFEIETSIDGKLIEVPYLIDKNTCQIDINIISKLRNLLNS
jgi:hypothetical protein